MPALTELSLSQRMAARNGKCWEVFRFAYVHDLVIHPRDNMIVIATHGRGIWVMDANPINEKDKQSTRR